jgi:D-sedoheptulose 7-phosphate isomerase
MNEKTFAEYAKALHVHLAATQATYQGRPIVLESGIERFLSEIRDARERGSKLMWMGNGGSAAIAAHEANDFMKNGNCRSQAFHEAAAITCISNDIGYAAYFEEMIRRFADSRDIAVFISSSGNSENVVRGGIEARKRGCLVVTMTGFKPDNKLRPLGDLSFYVPSSEYGYVELAHQILCHAVLDFLFKDDNEKAASKAAEQVRIP